MASYNIQLANYTQFLPQDIVKLFPALTPQQLLMRTEDALDDSSLKGKHEKLIELKEASNAKDGNHRVKQKHLQDMLAQQDKLKSEVEKFNEWTKLDEEIKKMKMRQPQLRFEVKQNLGQELKVVRKEAKGQYNQFIKQLEAATKPLEEQRALKKDLDNQVKEKTAEKRRKVNQHNKAQEDLSQMEEDLEKAMDDLKEVDKGERKRQDKMSKLQEEIARLQEQHDQVKAAQAGDQGDAHARRLKLTKEKQGLLGEQREANDALNKMKRDGGKLRNEISKLEGELQAEKNASGRILGALRKRENGGSEDLVRLARIVEEQKELFRKEVYCPIAMHVSVRNKELARFIETLVDRSLRCAFVTQDERDRETLNGLMTRNNIKGIRCINYVTNKRTNYSPPVPSAQLKQYGVLGYMDEAFDAPDIVKKVLNDSAKLHQIAFGDNKAEKQANNEAIFAAGVQILISPNKQTRANRSVHTGRMSYSTGVPQPRAHLLGEGEDKEKVGRLTQRIDELNAELEGFGTTFSQKRTAVRAVEQRITEVSAQLDELTKAGREVKKLEQGLVTAKNKLEKLQQAPSVEKQREKIRKDVVKLNDKRLKKLHAYVGSMRGYMAVCAEHDLAGLKASSMTEHIRQLEAAKREAQDLCDEAKEEYDSVTEKYKDCMDSLKDLKRKAEAVEVPPEVLTYWGTLPPDHFMNDPEQLSEQIRTDQARADAMVTENGQQMVQLYKRQEAQIAQLQAEFQNMETEKATRLQEIADLEESWLPKLRGSVEKINEAFAKAMAEMGFCGEVGLRDPKDNPADPENSGFDYSNFAIDIRVRFKEEQMLRSLDKHTQSGGEKSVSTMLYLVSLQELTDYPFRVVDEINQGMDARNERKMFEQIVRAASRDDCPQYFVITPKLLPGLDFNDAVTTHFVWNAPAAASLDFNHMDFNLSKHAVANNPNKRVRTG